MSDAPKRSFAGFGLANYRSFDEGGFFIDRVAKINIFIGKNNCGKSNILRALRVLKRIDKARMSRGGGHGELGLNAITDPHRSNGRPLLVSVSIPVPDLTANPGLYDRFREAVGDWLRIDWNAESGEGKINNDVSELDDRQLAAILHVLTNTEYLGGRPGRDKMLSDLTGALVPRAIDALRFFESLIYVESSRDVRQSRDAQNDCFNGKAIIDRLRIMQHPSAGQEQEQEQFRAIQQYVRDLLSEDRLELEVPKDDVILVNMHGNRLPLESYGTGVHQLVLLCAALAIYKNFVVAIEEPETAFHPELQRRFLQFIADNTDNTYFITTHSNVFLDFRDDVAIYHVTHDGTKSSVTRVDATARAREVVGDLGYKASDLLQANCILWVEGPSDRVYLNKWLSLIAPDLTEGIHYSITFYGGKILAHFAAVDEPADDLVEVLRINRHAIFVMDQDAVKPGGKLNATKERVRAEIGDNQCWVTQGREIENYLRPELLKAYLTERCEQPISIVYSRKTRVDRAIATATKDTDGGKIDYAARKVAYARAFSERMTDADLDVLDLRGQLTQLVRLIRQWNHIDTDGTPAPEAVETTDPDH